MSKLDRQELVELVVDKYFANVDKKEHESVMACFAPDSVLRIASADVEHHGHDGIGRMFTDFTHIVDVDAQTIASQFVAKNTYEDGSRVEMRNCNFFAVEDGVFTKVTIYMTDENPLV